MIFIENIIWLIICIGVGIIYLFVLFICIPLHIIEFLVSTTYYMFKYGTISFSKIADELHKEVERLSNEIQRH